MVCVTWNVNSLRARLARVEEFLLEVKPDFLLLQETKCSPEQFPHEAIEAAGYRAIDHSGGRWCGVAVLVPESSKATLASVGLPGEPNPDASVALLDSGTRTATPHQRPPLWSIAL